MKNGTEKKERYYIKAKFKQDENNEKKVKILDEAFINKNRNKCKIIYKNKIYELKEYLEDIDIFYSRKDLIKFKFMFIDNIIDMSFMFYECNSLISLSDNNEKSLDISYLHINIINMKCLFNGCKSLISLPDISKWDTSNVNDMSYMLFKCVKLISLPDISKWNTSNVKNMSCMFNICNLLESIPDISKWSTSNVNNMSSLFHGCKSLISLPDISKWDTSNVKDMSYMFCGCKSLISLPDISKWDITNVHNMIHIYDCEFSFKFPDIYIFNKYKNYIIFELTHKINKDENIGKIKILGTKFIERYRNKCSIIYNKNEFDLKEYFEDIDNNNNKEIIKFLLCLNKDINSLSHIFDGCKSLISVEYFKINNKSYEINNKINNKSDSISSYLNRIDSKSNDNICLDNIFLNSMNSISNISNQSDIHNFSGEENFQNSSVLFSQLTDISYMFCGCKSLISLPDISKWNTSSVKDMSYMFCGCKSLI